MNDHENQPMQFHESLRDLFTAFHCVIASITWLKKSVKIAQDFHQNDSYIIQLPCSVTDQVVKIDKSIFTLVENEGFDQKAPLSSQTMINFYRVFTIAAKDIIWEEPDFKSFLQSPELHFLRHIRNASAHHNKFSWGKGKQRNETIQKLPVSWRGKVIEESLEGTTLYMDFIKPGDLLFLLSDINKLVS